MAGEALSERDTSLDGTLADALITGELQKTMKFIFPGRWNRMRAYGKLVIAPILRHPLRSTWPGGFSGERGRQIQQKISKENTEWTLQGDRCSPEARANIETNLLIDSAFRDLPDSPTPN